MTLPERQSTQVNERAFAENASTLAESLDRLTSEVQSMRGEMDELREEVAWAMRVLLPGKVGETALSETQPSERLNEELERMMTFVAEGQLEVLLVALDDVRDEIIKAIRGKGAKGQTEIREAGPTARPNGELDSKDSSTLKSPEPVTSQSAPPDSTGNVAISTSSTELRSKRPPPGQLF